MWLGSTLWISVLDTQEKRTQYSTKLKNLKYENLLDVLRETTSWGRVSNLDFSLQLCETLISMEIKTWVVVFLLKDLAHYLIYSTKHLLRANKKLCCDLPSTELPFLLLVNTQISNNCISQNPQINGSSHILTQSHVASDFHMTMETSRILISA